MAIDVKEFILLRKVNEQISILKNKKNGFLILSKKADLKKGFDEIAIYQKLNEIACNSFPKMIDYEVIQNNVLIYLTYIHGETLKEICAQKKLRNSMIEHFNSIFDHAIHILKSIHDAGILHRDIKPENIVIDRENRLYLIDFSVASLKTKPFNTVGTSLYLAPEAVFTPSEIDETSDLYSLAMSFKHELKDDLMKLPYDYLERIIRMSSIQKINRKNFD